MTRYARGENGAFDDGLCSSPGRAERLELAAEPAQRQSSLSGPARAHARRIRGFRAADAAIGTGSHSARACGSDGSPGSYPVRRVCISIANLRAPIGERSKNCGKNLISRRSRTSAPYCGFLEWSPRLDPPVQRPRLSTKRSWSSSDRDSAVVWRRPLGSWTKCGAKRAARWPER